jgi:hypothetical protein
MSNAKLEPAALQFGRKVQDILHDANGSSELHAYVNYAYGDETLQECMVMKIGGSRD